MVMIVFEYVFHSTNLIFRLFRQTINPIFAENYWQGNGESWAQDNIINNVIIRFELNVPRLGSLCFLKCKSKIIPTMKSNLSHLVYLPYFDTNL